MRQSSESGWRERKGRGEIEGKGREKSGERVRVWCWRKGCEKGRDRKWGVRGEGESGV